MLSTEHAKWKQLNNVWWQKLIFNKSGLPVYSYHYKAKSCKPCTVFEIDTKISKQYGAYVLVEKDLRDTLTFLEEYQRILNAKNIIDKKILLKGWVRVIVITYGKCFVDAHGRKVKLEESIISTQNKEYHHYLMKMRHEYVAHAGESEHESCKGVFPLPPKKSIKKEE